MSPDITPFENCPSLDGYHCQTNALAKILRYHGHPMSEDMILGLGAGMGFIYWKMRIGSKDYVFMGGRSNTKGFFADFGRRTGLAIRVVSTASAEKAQASLLEELKKKQPVMLFGDMGFLPWFDFPEGYHFGGHTFVVCGYDGKGTVLASDTDQKAAGLKKGFYYPITLDQLKKARSSTYKPFPPRNGYLQFDLKAFHEPGAEDVREAMRQTVESQLNPPIKNLGLKGIRHASKKLLKWPQMFDDHELRMNLFMIYVSIEIGGTGGGCFRYMYSRFLEESAGIAKDDRLMKPAAQFRKAGEMFSEIAALFEASEKADDLSERIGKASAMFHAIAELEEKAYGELARIVR